MRGPKSTATIAQKKLNPETTKKKKAYKSTAKKANKSTAKKDKAWSKNSGALNSKETSDCVFRLHGGIQGEFPHNKSVSVVAKEGGVKWKAMSESEKAPYVAKAVTKKAEYGIAMKQHNDDLNGTAKEKSSSTSKSSMDTNDDVE